MPPFHADIMHGAVDRDSRKIIKDSLQETFKRRFIHFSQGFFTVHAAMPLVQSGMVFFGKISFGGGALVAKRENWANRVGTRPGGAQSGQSSSMLQSGWYVVLDEAIQWLIILLQAAVEPRVP
ncbi:MAG: hypothetical protein AAGC95_04815 [Pseudomonadota bacterium]